MKGSTSEFTHFVEVYKGAVSDIGHDSGQAGSPFVDDEIVITVVIRRSAGQAKNCLCCYLTSTSLWPHKKWAYDGPRC